MDQAKMTSRIEKLGLALALRQRGCLSERNRLGPHLFRAWLVLQ